MAQNQATALSVDAEFVYWANSYSLGSILRCPLSGCTTGPEVLVANQPWIQALAKDGKSIFWISNVGEGTGTQKEAAVMRCPIDGCASSSETLAVQTFSALNAAQGTPMASDGTDLYWVTKGRPDGMLRFPHATIYRYTK